MVNKLFWNFYAFCYDSLLKFNPYLEMTDKIIKELDPKPGEKILDAGCGTGNLEVAINKVCKETDIVAIDFSEIMLKRAKKKVGKTVVFHKLNLCDQLPFPDNHFDSIVSINALHAMPNPLKAINELSRILKHNGKMIVVTLKKDFQMPLILKNHAHKNEPQEKWVTKNLFGWFKLVFKAFGFDVIALKFIFIAIFNKIVDKEIKGFDKDALNNMLLASGMEIEKSELIYGDQDFLFILKKPAIWIKPINDEESLKRMFSMRSEIFIKEGGLPLGKDIDEYDTIAKHFLVIENGEEIGTMRLIKMSEQQEKFRGLYRLPFEFNFESAMEISRVAIKKDKRGRRNVFFQMLKCAHYYGKMNNQLYLCGTMKTELMNYFKRINWQFEFVSEPFSYYGKWQIVAFISSIDKNIRKLN